MSSAVIKVTVKLNISVVIPTLNEEPRIGRCLDSVVAQLEQGDDVLIVDGGSTDNTVGIAGQYPSVRTILYEGSSIGQARDRGVREARNKIVFSTDADTVFPLEFINRLRRYFLEDSDLVAVTGSAKPIDGSMMHDAVYHYMSMFGGIGANTAFKKNVYLETDGYPDRSLVEDLALWLKIKGLGYKVLNDPSLIIYMESDSWYVKSLPSYLIATVLAGLGYATRKNHEILSRLLFGGSAGFALGQLGADVFSRIGGSSQYHYHHWHLGGLMVGGAATLQATRLIKGKTAAGLYGFGWGLILHDVLTETFGQPVFSESGALMPLLTEIVS